MNSEFAQYPMKSINLGNGIYTMLGHQIEFTPSWIGLPRYCDEWNLGNEVRELAVRILWWSKKSRAWVGIAQTLLIESIERDKCQFDYWLAMREVNRLRLDKYMADIRRYESIDRYTLGLYSRLVSGPTLEFEDNIDMSWLSSTAIHNTRVGIESQIRWLVDTGMLEERSERYLNRSDKVLYPTPALATMFIRASEEVGVTEASLS